MLVKINPNNPQERIVRGVVEVLKMDGIVAYPTDTYYGIGCDIMNKKAIEKIYWLKHRRKTKPFSFICSGLKNISHYAKVSNYAYKTMRRLLPGPYTFILEGSRLVPKIMLTKRKTAGIRVPADKICIALVEGLGNPIISTSATTPQGAIFDDPSLIHDYYGVTKVHDEIHIVLDKEEGFSSLAKILNVLGQLSHQGRIHSCPRFIQKDHFRLSH